MASDKTIKVRIHADVPVTIGDMVALKAAPTVMRKFAAADGVSSVEEFGTQIAGSA